MGKSQDKLPSAVAIPREEEILARYFLDAVKRVLWEPGKKQERIKFRIYRYLMQNPVGDVLSETQAVFPRVAPAYGYVSAGEWEAALERIMKLYILILPGSVVEKRRKSIKAFFENMKFFGK